MSLRARLTLLYASMLGGILLVFGTIVYLFLNFLLINQVDATLVNAANGILSSTRVNSVGELTMLQFPDLGLSANVFVQLWDRQGNLRNASPSIADITVPLDPLGINSATSVFRDITIQSIRLRVLSVPLEIGGHSVGVMQAGTALTIVDTTRQALLSILIFSTAISMALAALFSWLSIGKALSPLKMATETAAQITRAHDLSRRIPTQYMQKDEIGTLIQAFNSTLERLETLFTAQQRFLADVSHELRTPLTVIKGNADLIRKLGPDEESLTSIKDEADRMTRMVGDLLLLAQAESGKLPLTVQPLELDALLLEVLQSMQVLAGEKVSLKLTEIDQVLINADRDRVKQVLINIISNAIQYTPQGGSVSVKLSKNEGGCQLQIKDTGAGIPAEDLPHIFDRFYRAEKSRSRTKTSGYGLGLSIAHAIIERHGGQIQVDSKLGKGTTFCISFPLL